MSSGEIVAIIPERRVAVDGHAGIRSDKQPQEA